MNRNRACLAWVVVCVGTACGASRSENEVSVVGAHDAGRTQPPSSVGREVEGADSQQGDAGGLLGPAPCSSPGGCGIRIVVPVLAPTASGPATKYVSPSGNDSWSGTKDRPWRSLIKAAASVAAGDVVDVADGSYSGPVHITARGTEAHPIVFRAAGTGAVVNSGTNATERDAFFIEEAAYIVISGLRASGAYRAGLRISLSHHITVENGAFLDNGKWGIFTDYADDILVAGNECARSRDEHGIYYSNSGKRAIIRGNYLHHNGKSGVQINADPAEDGDGISLDCVVEDNVIVANGKNGAAGINLASVRRSRIQNNFLVENVASGIALWDDDAGLEWGCKDNWIVRNTVVMPDNAGRFALSILNGSTGNHVYNNVFVGGRSGAWTIDETSLHGTGSDFNVFAKKGGGLPIQFEHDDSEDGYSLAAWQRFSGHDAHSLPALPSYLTSTGVGLVAGLDGGDGRLSGYGP